MVFSLTKWRDRVSKKLLTKIIRMNMALFQRKNEEKYKNLTIIYLILVTIQEPERKQQRS